MNWKRNSGNIITGLSVALGVCVVIIAYLLFNCNGQKEYVQIQPPPQQKVVESPLPPPPPQNKPTMVLFHSEHCGHCKNMMPAWEQMKYNLEKMGQIDVISLDEKTHGQEMRKFGVEGFPDVRLYPGGFPMSDPIMYRGNRSFESLMKFATSGGANM